MRPKHWQLMDLTHKYEFKSTYLNIYYRPHPKDGEGTVFTGVCLHLMGGYPSPRFFPRSLVLGTFWEVPQSCPGGLCQSWPRGVPQNMGTPLARTGLGYPPPPCQDRTGVPPPPPRDRTAERTLATWLYATCVHARELSCFFIRFFILMKHWPQEGNTRLDLISMTDKM